MALLPCWSKLGNRLFLHHSTRLRTVFNFEKEELHQPAGPASAVAVCFQKIVFFVFVAVVVRISSIMANSFVRGLLPSKSGDSASPAQQQHQHDEQWQPASPPPDEDKTPKKKKKAPKRNSKKKEASPPPGKSTSPPSPTAGGGGGGGGGIEQNNRYKHDIEQAMAMQSRMRQGSFRKAAAKRRSLSSDDVALALKGLDQAEEYAADEAKLDEALKLYELSLELLIKVLREPATPSSAEGNDDEGSGATKILGVDKETLEARVHAGLSDAEAVKSKLVRQRQQEQQQQGKSQRAARQQQQQSSAESSSESSPFSLQGFQSMTNALASAIQSTLPTTATTKTATQPARQQQQQQQQQRCSAAANPRRTTRSTAGNQQQPQPTAAAATSTKPSDELRQTVISDFYVDPSSLQQTTWDDICGLEKVKQSLQESAILPFVRPDLFGGLRKPQNILLYGPPGTGKTLLARACASESSSNLFIVSAGTLTSKWMGESEKIVKTLFAMATGEMAPSIVFVDEVDSLLSSRKSDGNEHEASRRLKTEFMVQMDGILQGSTGAQRNSKYGGDFRVLLLACTNCPWDIDTAILRRFPKRIYVPLPDEASRKALLKSLLKKAGKHSITAKEMNYLVERTEGYSGSDLTAVASDASFGPLRALGGLQAIKKARARDVRPICLQDFETALEQTPKSVTSEHIHRYDEWRKQQST